MANAGGWWRHRGVQLSVGIAVSIGCLWWAVSDLLKDPQALTRIRDAFLRANYITLPVILLAQVGFYWLKAWRWRLLLKPAGDFQTTRDLVPPTMIGFAFNNLLPAHLGDIVRVLLFAQKHRLTRTAVLSSAILERVFDVITVLAFLGIGLAFVPGLDPKIKQTALVFAAAATVAVAIALIYVLFTKWFVRIVEAVLDRLPGVPAGLKHKLAGMLEAGATGLAAIKNPRLMCGVVTASVGQWLLNGLLVHLSLWSFGVHVSPLVSLIVLSVTAFGVTVPSSPGYFGVIQACFMSVLRLFTDDQVNVFAASVYFHLSQYIPVTLTGLYFFNTQGLKFSDVESQAEAEAQTQPEAETESEPRD